MNKKEKAQLIISILDKFYKKTPVPLKHSSPYTLLVAVLLSAQCTDERVNKVTPVLFKKANNPKDMMGLSYDDVYSIIKPCGLGPKKARAIISLSKTLTEDYNMRVPKDLALLEKLPGVGHKTASVVISQAFNIPAFPVDTHIHRLAARWGLSNGSNVTKTEKDLKAVFSRDLWNRLHLQIIFFGREHCPARNHDLKECPICSWAATKKRIASEVK